MTDLSLIPAIELADELMRRASCGIVMLTTIEQVDVYVNWVGPYHEALGMTVDMADHIKEDRDE